VYEPSARATCYGFGKGGLDPNREMYVTYCNVYPAGCGLLAPDTIFFAGLSIFQEFGCLETNVTDVSEHSIGGTKSLKADWREPLLCAGRKLDARSNLHLGLRAAGCGCMQTRMGVAVSCGEQVIGRPVVLIFQRHIILLTPYLSRSLVVMRRSYAPLPFFLFLRYLSKTTIGTIAIALLLK
jgi:hypothetical protein